MRIRFRFIAEWRDLWVGVFIDTRKQCVYILPVPCVGIVVDYSPPEKSGLGAAMRSWLEDEGVALRPRHSSAPNTVDRDSPGLPPVTTRDPGVDVRW